MRVILVPTCLYLLGLCEATTAQALTEPEVIQELVRIANDNIKKTACEGSIVGINPTRTAFRSTGLIFRSFQ